MTQNPQIDYDAIIRENERKILESKRLYAHMVADHERQIAIISIETQIAIDRMFREAWLESMKLPARRVTVAM